MSYQPKTAEPLPLLRNGINHEAGFGVPTLAEPFGCDTPNTEMSEGARWQMFTSRIEYDRYQSIPSTVEGIHVPSLPTTSGVKA